MTKNTMKNADKSILFILTMIILIIGNNQSFSQSVPLEDVVWDVKWNSNGTMYAIANPQGSVYLYNLNGGLVRTLSAHIDRTFSVDWNPDGSIIATSGSDPYIRFWEVDTGILIEEIFTFDGGIFAIDWQSDGTYLVAIGFDGFRILNTDNMMFLEKTIFGTYFDIQWKPNTDFFAFANQGFIGTGEVDNGDIVGHTFQSETKRYLTSNWNSDGTKAVFSEEISGNIAIWDIGTETLEKTFYMGSEVSDAIFVGDFVVTATKNGTIQVVNILTEEIEIVAVDLGKINAIDRNPNNNQIIYVGVTNSGETLVANVDVTGFAGLPPAFSISLFESDTSISLTESVATDTYTLALGTQPTADVVVSVAGTDTPISPTVVPTSAVPPTATDTPIAP